MDRLEKGNTTWFSIHGQLDFFAGYKYDEFDHGLCKYVSSEILGILVIRGLEYY